MTWRQQQQPGLVLTQLQSGWQAAEQTVGLQPVLVLTDEQQFGVGSWLPSATGSALTALQRSIMKRCVHLDTCSPTLRQSQLLAWSAVLLSYLSFRYRVCCWHIASS
jgi:hypothetical protein